MDKKRITTLEDFGDIQLRNLGQDVVSEQAIREAVTLFSNLVPGATQDEIAEAVKNLKTRYFIRMDTGTTLRDKDTYVNGTMPHSQLVNKSTGSVISDILRMM